MQTRPIRITPEAREANARYQESRECRQTDACCCLACNLYQCSDDALFDMLADTRRPQADRDAIRQELDARWDRRLGL